MKKRISQIILWLVLSNSVFLQLPVIAQKTVKPAKVIWYMDFTLTIKGNGHKEAERDGEQEITWKINRTYSGNMEISGPYSLPEMTNQTQVSKGLEMPNFRQVETYKSFTSEKNSHSVRIEIADELRIRNFSPGEMSTFENRTEETKWEENATEYGSGSGVKLRVDNKTGTYNVAIDPAPFLNFEKKVKVTKKTGIDRSAVGYGGKSTHEETPAGVTFMNVGDIGFPKVSEIFAGDRSITHSKYLPLPANFNTSWKYDSGELSPDEPFIKGVPDSKTNLKIRVIYRFSRKPLF